MLDSTSVATVILLAAASSLLLAAMLYPAALLRWFQRKRYQYEVTFSLYMLTSTEKFIFSTSTSIDLKRVVPRCRHEPLSTYHGQTDTRHIN